MWRYLGPSQKNLEQSKITEGTVRRGQYLEGLRQKLRVTHCDICCMMNCSYSQKDLSLLPIVPMTILGVLSLASVFPPLITSAISTLYSLRASLTVQLQMMLSINFRQLRVFLKAVMWMVRKWVRLSNSDSGLIWLIFLRPPMYSSILFLLCSPTNTTSSFSFRCFLSSLKLITQNTICLEQGTLNMLRPSTQSLMSSTYLSASMADTALMMTMSRLDLRVGLTASLLVEISFRENRPHLMRSFMSRKYLESMGCSI